MIHVCIACKKKKLFMMGVAQLIMQLFNVIIAYIIYDGMELLKSRISSAIKNWEAGMNNAQSRKFTGSEG